MAIDIHVTVRPATPPIEVVKPIKPSEAIRLGCLLAPIQAFDDYTDGEGTACAMGAMNIGWGKSPDAWVLSDEEGLLPNPFNACPAADCNGHAAIPHLNDDHRWSRERIADWLESLGL